MSAEKKKKEIARKIPLKLKGVSDATYAEYINRSKSRKERLEEGEKFNKDFKEKFMWGRGNGK